MQAGDLRHRVGFFKRAELPEGDARGNFQGDYPGAPEFQCRANIRPRFGAEQITADRVTAHKIVNITVRSSSVSRQVTEDWMVRDLGASVSYNIRSIIDPYQSTPRRGQWLEMLCEAGAETGGAA